MVVLVSFSYLNSPAQVVVLSSPSQASGATARFVNTVNRFNNPPPEYVIDGTPYLNDEFIRGTIYWNKGGSYPGLEMRYNIFNDQVEFKNQDSVYAILPDIGIKKIVIDKHTLIVNNYEIKGTPVLTYFLRLDSGKATLLTKMHINFRERQAEKPIEGALPPKYVKMPDEYYYKIRNGSSIKIQSMKKLIEELPDGKQEMEQFAKANKISANKPKELIKFFQYYNSLKQAD